MNIVKGFNIPGHAAPSAGVFVGDVSKDVATAPDKIACVAACTVHFAGLRDACLKWINEQEIVVGCVAWLTNDAIIGTINSRRAAQVIMQKEDWLRPDTRGQHPAKKNPSIYQQDSGVDRWSLVYGLSLNGDPGVGRYRCFGWAGDRQKRPRLRGRPRRPGRS